MKFMLSERSFVIVLFILVVFTFSVAQTESKKIEKLYTETQVSNSSSSNVIAEGRLDHSRILEILKEKTNKESLR